jgi:hypothetical protein
VSYLSHGGFRCFGSDRATGVAPQGAFWSRTVLPTVAQWFMLDARETVDSCVQVLELAINRKEANMGEQW